MCGIYLTNIPFTEEEVRWKLDLIKFRGPDFTGIKKIGDLIFGHLRLSIIDLDSRSNQPMQFEDLTIVFNGEIYNFQDIKRDLVNLGYEFSTTSDTEVLIKGFKEWGYGIVPRLNGMFAFAIFNSATQKIFCSRDRLGVKPFYYSWRDGKFEICSQLRPIAQQKNINDEAISMYLDCTYIPSPFTIFQDVFKLPPGNNLEIDIVNGAYTVKEYWNLEVVKESELTYEEAKEKMHLLIVDAVKIRLNSDVPFGCFLSGGIDSALVSSIAARLSDKKVKTFSIGFTDPKFDESKVASQFAGIIGSDHIETICDPDNILEMLKKHSYVYDEPFGDSSALPTLLLNKVTKQYVTMALSGDGGDESFLGYNHFDWVTKFHILLKIPYFTRSFLSNFLVMDIFGARTSSIKNFFSLKSRFDFISGIFTGYNTLLLKRDLSWLRNYNNFTRWTKNIHQQTADLNIKLWLENDSNVKVDRASMAASVEVRSPFLDYRIIEFARSLPVSYRYKLGRKKIMLRDILKEYIPEVVFDQPKRGFAVPIGKWIKYDLREEFLANLSDDFLNQVPNLNVPKFKRVLQDHLDGKADNSSFIWRVYVLSKWYQEFGYYKKSIG